MTQMTFETSVHQALWGSESWEISAHPTDPGVIAAGEAKGRRLNEVYPNFPLLFKVIDAKTRLSVQVHPNEETCKVTGGEPKTEMWCALSDGPIYAGLREGTTAADVEALHRANLFNYAVNKVVRKRFLDEHQIRFDADGMPCEDVIFCIQEVLAGAKWCAVPFEGYVYYLNANGSIVTSYSQSFSVGTRLAAQMWAKYCAVHPDASPYLRKLALTEEEITRSEWGNIWKKGSPYSLVGRWRWMREKTDWGVGEFVKMALRTLVRRYLYLRPLRRWHYRSLYANVESLKV